MELIKKILINYSSLEINDSNLKNINRPRINDNISRIKIKNINKYLVNDVGLYLDIILIFNNFNDIFLNH